jgi:hypothetical protein
MKKLLFLIAAVSTLLIGCGQQEDQTSPPLDAGTNAPANTQ